MKVLAPGLAVVAVLAAPLAGCSGGGTPAAAPSTAVPTSVGPAARTTVDIGGPEAYGLAVDDDSVWAISYQAGTLSQVDPVAGTVRKSVPLGPGAASVMALDGGLWVASYAGADSSITRLDAATGKAVATIKPGEVCCDLTAGGGAVWAVDPNGAVLRIDPATNKVTKRFPVTIDRNWHIGAVYAGDSIWISSDNTDLSRVDPTSGKVTKLDVGGGVPFLARDGMLWGATPDSLWVVDAQTGKVVREIPLENSTEVMALGLGFDAIWVGIRHPGRVGAVLKLDAASGRQVSEVPVDIPARIEIGFGSVWVTDSGSSNLVRIAP